MACTFMIRMQTLKLYYDIMLMVCAGSLPVAPKVKGEEGVMNGTLHACTCSCQGDARLSYSLHVWVGVGWG